MQNPSNLHSAEISGPDRASAPAKHSQQLDVSSAHCPWLHSRSDNKPKSGVARGRCSGSAKEAQTKRRARAPVRKGSPSALHIRRALPLRYNEVPYVPVRMLPDAFSRSCCRRPRGSGLFVARAPPCLPRARSPLFYLSSGPVSGCYLERKKEKETEGERKSR